MYKSHVMQLLSLFLKKFGAINVIPVGKVVVWIVSQFIHYLVDTILPAEAAHTMALLLASLRLQYGEDMLGPSRRTIYKHP